VAFAEALGEGGETWRARPFALGSLVKPFIAAAAIDAGLASPEQVYDCRDPYEVAGRKFWNADHDLTDLNLTEAMVQSANVCLIRVAQDLGSERLRASLDSFGLATSSTWRRDRSDALQLAEAAVGKNIVADADSLTRAFAILAHRGQLFPSGTGSVVTEASADSVTAMLTEVVARGTGRRAAIDGLTVAGKTATHSWSTETAATRSHLAQFVGYVPSDSPLLLALVMLEDGHELAGDAWGNGGSIAAPVFQALVSKVLAGPRSRPTERPEGPSRVPSRG